MYTDGTTLKASGLQAHVSLGVEIPSEVLAYLQHRTSTVIDHIWSQFWGGQLRQQACNDRRQQQRESLLSS